MTTKDQKRRQSLDVLASRRIHRECRAREGQIDTSSLLQTSRRDRFGIRDSEMLTTGTDIH